uniref:ATPase, coupled to transmembrane movement of ions, phosphorylative mechanism n=1 Tax=Solanum tuberosum TaxID=4113 RepID=M1AA99_SOLTU
MDFLKSPIAGLQYGTRASDVKLAAAKQLAETWAMAEWILAICYASVPEQNEETRGLNCESESPDEVSFLVAAKRIRLSFSKELNQVFLQETGLPFKWFLFCRRLVKERKEKSFFYCEELLSCRVLNNT